MALPDQFVTPDYSGPCVTNIVPALLEHPAIGTGWMPSEVVDARAVVLFVVDGLGWHQLQARSEITPVLSAGRGGPITTVAPSTTAAALTSVCTGAPPGEHGIVGYKIRLGGETLNCLRWTTGRGDARSTIPPREFQPLPAFGGRAPVVVNKAEFVASGLTVAHQDGVDYRGYSTVSALVWEVEQAIAAGERFVYTYYDGLDRTGHERGHGGAFDAEFAFVDRLVGDLRRVLPEDVALLVTADHGQVDTAGHVHPLAPELRRRVHAVSGEDRFVWLHSADPTDALACARDLHSDHAHALSADEVVELGLLGQRVTSAARERLGDVALLATGCYALVDPEGRVPNLLGRHGSLTADEMLVPLLAI